MKRHQVGWGCGLVWLAAMACSSTPSESIGVARSRIEVAPATKRVMGFENLNDWVVLGGSAVLSGQRVEGSTSLQMASNGWVSATSVRFAGPLDATPLLAFDVLVPHAQLPNWNGQAQVFLDAPSLGIYNVPLAATQFTFPYAVFQRMQYQLSNELVAKLRGSYADLRVTIALSGTAGAYYLDNLRFIDANEALAPMAPISHATIRDFEDPNLWTAYAPAVLTRSDRRVHGSYSLAVSNIGWTRLDSAPSTRPGNIGPYVAFDMLVPSPQINPWWRGDVELLVSLPSAGITDLSLGRRSLLEFPLDQFQRIQFPVPAQLQTLLPANTYKDLRFTLVLNVPHGTPGSYLIDHLRLRADDGTTNDIELPSVDTMVAGTRGTNTAPADAIPALGGSGAAAVTSVRDFIAWLMISRPSQVGDARAAIEAVATNDDVANAAVAEVDIAGDVTRNLVVLSMIGELKNTIAENALTQLVNLAVPTGEVDSEPVLRVTMVQTKAIDGLAFTRTATSRAKLLDVIANHPVKMVRIEAIRAYLDTYGSSVRAEVQAVAHADEQLVMDSFPYRSEVAESATYDQKLRAYLVQHPETLPPNP